jgi:hypothetical protein
MTSRDGRLVESVLIEVDRDGRPTRLELTNASGLLTLHPEPMGMLHGNVVTPSGIRHIALPWGKAHEIAIDRLPIAGAVTARRLAPLVGVGEGRDIDVVVVSDDLEASPATRRYDRVTAMSWRVQAGQVTQMMTIDEDGVPTRSDRGGEPVDWALELQ